MTYMDDMRYVSNRMEVMMDPEFTDDFSDIDKLRVLVLAEFNAARENAVMLAELRASLAHREEYMRTISQTIVDREAEIDRAREYINVLIEAMPPSILDSLIQSRRLDGIRTWKDGECGVYEEVLHD